MTSQETRNTVLVACEIAATAATIYLAWRVIAGPDAIRSMNMRAAKVTENFCQSQAVLWAHMADRSARAYDKARQVSV